MAKSCSTVASSQIQQVFVVQEDVSGTLQRPTANGFIMPAGFASLSQSPEYTNSDELTGALDVIDQFRNALTAGEASIPMIVRVPSDGSKMQGHALFESLMGGVQAPGAVTAEAAVAVDSTDTVIAVSAISGGFFPKRGVVSIGSEKIRYLSVSRDPSGAITDLTGCVRGYAKTTAANHAAKAVVTLNSRVFFWDNCRPTLSVWLKADHTVLFASGAVVTQTTIPQSKEGGQHCDFTLQFRKMGWCGRSYLASLAAGGVLSVETEEHFESAVDAYSVGGIIKNTTKNDDNGGAGYTITAVDSDNRTITISPAPTGWEEDDQIDPWLPEASPIGDPLQSADVRVFIDNTAGKLTEGSITIGTPTSFTSEIGDDYPGENADSLREISMTNGLYFRAKDAVEFQRGYDGYQLSVDVVLGNKAGGSLALAMPRVQFNMPSISESDSFVTLTREGAVLGTKGNDSLYIIQE